MSNTLLDPGAFYASFRSKKDGPHRIMPQLDAVQVGTINAILAAASLWPTTWVAYALATAWHESRFRPVHEIGKGRGKPYGQPGRHNQSQHGRGLVQLTWDYNYEWADKALGLGGRLISNFDLALEPVIATHILVRGMEEGAFTGKSLAHYLDPSKDTGSHGAYRKARRIINGTDKADMIAGYAVKFEQALRQGQWGDHTVAPAPVLAPPPAPPKPPEVDAPAPERVVGVTMRAHPASVNEGSNTMLKSKTTWTAVTALVAALAAYATGEASLIEAGTAAIIALTALFQRHATAKLDGRLSNAGLG